ncbi:MAG: hypothetical protein WC374_07210 [Phycisphaerae bacterium]|jgi:hypothetical protein
MKYYEPIVVAFLTVFVILASIAIERLFRVRTDACLTREAMEQLRDDAKMYNEWIQRVTNPAVGIK